MFLNRLRRRRVLGFTLIEVMAVSGIMASLHSGGNYQYIINQARELNGLNNLRQLYQLLPIGEPLPSAAFYPKGDPLKDPKSIVRMIEGAPKELFVSPFAPDALKRSGLTYAWNDTVNGREIDKLPKGTWLLIDVAAFIADPNVPKPGKYLVLYSDGRAEAITQLPEDIAKTVDEAKKKLEAAKPGKK